MRACRGVVETTTCENPALGNKREKISLPSLGEMAFSARLTPRLPACSSDSQSICHVSRLLVDQTVALTLLAARAKASMKLFAAVKAVSPNPPNTEVIDE